MKNASGDARRLVWLSVAVYFCSYVTRINYSAVLVEMILKEGYTRADASVAVTGLFVTYGVGQLVSGFLGDRVKPHMLMFFGLLTSSAMNLLIPFCPGPAWMTPVWCVNGFAQAMMWPPLVRILADYLSGEAYKTAVVRVSWGSSLGTVFIYLVAPLCITLGGWRLMFFLSAGVALVMTFLWLWGFRRLEARLKAERTADDDAADRTAAPVRGLAGLAGLLAVIMAAIIMQGLLKDGITTWMPSYLSENFDLGSAVSILTSVALPLFSIATFQGVSLLNRRLLKNELVCSAALFCCGAAALAVLHLIGGSVFWLAVVMLTLCSGCMHGVNLMLVCTVPNYFKKTGKTSFISGLLNSCTYVGSALSTYGVAVLTDRTGWGATVIVWAVAAAAGVVCCVLCARRWQRFKAE